MIGTGWIVVTGAVNVSSSVLGPEPKSVMLVRKANLF